MNQQCLLLWTHRHVGVDAANLLTLMALHLCSHVEVHRHALVAGHQKLGKKKSIIAICVLKSCI